MLWFYNFCSWNNIQLQKRFWAAWRAENLSPCPRWSGYYPSMVIAHFRGIICWQVCRRSRSSGPVSVMWQVESSPKSRNLFPDNFLCIWGQSLMSIKTRKITSQQFGISVFVFQWLKQMHWKEDSLRITTTKMRSEISSLLQYMSLRSVS